MIRLRRTHLAMLSVVALGGILVALAEGPVAAQEGEGAFDPEVRSILLTGSEYAFAVPLPTLATDLPDELSFRIADGDTELARGTLPTRDENGTRLEKITFPVVTFENTGPRILRFELGGERVVRRPRVIAGWLTILPPLLAILLAIVFRQVLVALASGIFLGAFFAHDFHLGAALLRTIDMYVVGSLADGGHASIIVFSLLLGGMIGVITSSGGGTGMARLVTTRATSSSRGLLSTWLLGIVIFFDDYANSLLVGSTMRPITDRLRISREKLAFYVDATAAPVSSVAIVSSWIGVEVGYIADQLSSLGIRGDAYLIFIETLPYRFYPLLMLFFGLALIYMKRDFGPMLRAEERARATGAVLGDGAKPATDFDAKEVTGKGDKASALDALVPIGVVVVVALGGMIVTGRASFLADHPGADVALRDIFGSADSTKALLWSAFLGSAAAIAISVSRRSLGWNQALDAWLGGVRAMVLACIILILAWSLGSICKELDTARFVIGAIGSWMSPGILGAVVFVVAALVSFATGTSWGTMAILFPLVMPLANDLAPGDHLVLLSAVSSILTGSVWGDHCSPISDTTILSSMAAGCDHVDHVRTQLPYALAVGIVSLVLGDLATGLGVYPAWVGLVLGAVALVVLLRFVGRPVADYVPTD